MEKINHIRLDCKVHLPNKNGEMNVVLSEIENLNEQLPDELEIVSFKTKGGVIVKIKDLRNFLGQ